ncbi:uncharacterized protein N0V89_010524 [Didymosphaeria variabile]|uniref:Heme haloperoxidase family profile domain-containing protein n=1 Tax=Didymosphaeria variabile TaxID=1932322 RepID=A0A9W8XBS1_9PLEO|nr:uncharacterized protein N0V89_010524 [Didymosphaeria variabile]KAJ4346593.1 hypothetical protein N0V89_010524 [Didymosphaeria variabile]
MLNSLANHGFLPHSGKEIMLNTTVHALGAALNINEEVATNLFNFAITTNPEPNATEFSLENLGRHNVLEHDASLTRADFDVTGDSVTFNQTVYEETRSYWTDTTITVQQAADARLARYTTSKATNANYSMSTLGDNFSAGESAAYLFILGNIDTQSVPRKFVEYLFENEKLPTEVGWVRPDHVFTWEDLQMGIELIYNATGTTGEAARKMRLSREIHGGSLRV